MMSNQLLYCDGALRKLDRKSDFMFIIFEMTVFGEFLINNLLIICYSLLQVRNFQNSKLIKRLQISSNNAKLQNFGNKRLVR